MTGRSRSIGAVFALARRDLQFRRRQFLVATVGAAAVFAMTLTLAGLSQGFRTEAANTVAAVGADTWVLPVGASGPFTSFSAVSSEQVDAVRSSPGVRTASPIVVTRHSARSGHRVFDVELIGGAPHVPVTSGRDAVKAGEAVVDRRASLPLGAHFSMLGRPFVVVGRTTGRSAFAGFPVVFLRLDDARTIAFGGRPLATALAVAGRPTRLPPGLAEATPQAARADLLRGLRNGITAIDNCQRFLWVVAAVIIGVVMYLSSLERRRDFAVLKALGGRSRTLAAVLTLEAVTVSMLAALAAMAAGRLLVPLFPLPVVIPTRALVMLPVTALVAGVFASLAGLRRAVGVDPALAFS